MNCVNVKYMKTLYIIVSYACFSVIPIIYNCIYNINKSFILTCIKFTHQETTQNKINEYDKKAIKLVQLPTLCIWTKTINESLKTQRITASPDSKSNKNGRVRL